MARAFTFTSLNTKKKNAKPDTNASAVASCEMTVEEFEAFWEHHHPDVEISDVKEADMDPRFKNLGYGLAKLPQSPVIQKLTNPAVGVSTEDNEASDAAPKTNNNSQEN